MAVIERRQEEGDVDFSIRMIELETANACGIRFDADWYSIPIYDREIMIAGRLGRQWISMLSEEEAVRKAK